MNDEPVLRLPPTPAEWEAMKAENAKLRVEISQLRQRTSPATEPCACPEFCTYHARANFDSMKIQNEEQQKKTDILYLGILGWFGYWRDKIPAEAPPSFHHAVDSIMGKRGRLSPEYVAKLREMAKTLDQENSTEKRINEVCWCAAKANGNTAVCPVHG